MRRQNSLLALPLLVPLGAVLRPALTASAVAAPPFRSPAAARAFGEQQERAGNYEVAAAAYLREATLRQAQGDPQGAEVERRRGLRLKTDLALAVTAPVTLPHARAKFEPAAGCYVGVLDEPYSRHADDFVARTRHPVAVVFDYNTYGQPFPAAWARRSAQAGRAVQIAWEPNQIAQVQDDAYLERWAGDAAAFGGPVFLRFGGEMNGAWTPWGRDPADYRRAFRLVHAVMARRAPNVAMVWAPNVTPLANLDQYFPGDDAVDWVGISLYLVRFYDDDLARPAWQDHPATLIAPFYAKYAARHPLCLAECGVTRRSRVEGRDADAFAAARVEDLFDALKVRFPRLKMVCWFDRNNLERAQPLRRLNDYSLPANSPALAAFQDAVTDPYFLGEVGGSAPYRYTPLTTRLPASSVGAVSASLVTYALNPTLEISRVGATRRVTRPFRFTLPPGPGPVTVQVRDPQGRVAATRRLAGR